MAGRKPEDIGVLMWLEREAELCAFRHYGRRGAARDPHPCRRAILGEFFEVRIVRDRYVRIFKTDESQKNIPRPQVWQRKFPDFLLVPDDAFGRNDERSRE